MKAHVDWQKNMKKLFVLVLPWYFVLYLRLLLEITRKLINKIEKNKWVRFRSFFKWNFTGTVQQMFWIFNFELTLSGIQTNDIPYTTISLATTARSLAQCTKSATYRSLFQSHSKLNITYNHLKCTC